MIGQDLEDRDDTEEPKHPRKVGVVMAEDDLNVGDYVCVYSLKKTPEDGAPIMGQSLHIKAICLPYFVGQLLSDPSEPVLTLDCRYLHLMRVTKEFVDAQREGAKQNSQPPQQMMPMPKKRRAAQPPQQDGQ
jgi:hypothetical protein